MRWIVFVLFFAVVVLSTLAEGFRTAYGQTHPSVPIYLPIVRKPLSTNQTIPSISAATDNRSDYPNAQIPTYKKYELTFQVTTIATNLQWPYTNNPPPGINPTTNPNHNGISVDAHFLPPGKSDWQQAYGQPAFVYQPYNPQGAAEGNPVWKVRFAPHLPGTWQYRLTATDSTGTATSSIQTFTVTNSTNKGFIKVSQADPRYFEFSDGTYFPAIGHHARTTYDQPGSGDRNDYLQFGQNGITLIRDWMSGFYGSAWIHWLGGNQMYDGYLPRTGLEGFTDPNTGQEYLTAVLATGSSTSGWYDACRLQVMPATNPYAKVKAHTNYRLQITYYAQDIAGPQNSSYPSFGLVGKIGGMGDWVNNCQNPNTLSVITTYGKNTSNWNSIEGTWNSGTNTTLPRIHLAIENATAGKVWLKSVTLREDLGNGQFGPEVIAEHSMEYESYYPERMAYELDQAIQAAEEANLYLKLVIGDKSDMMWWKMQNDGTFVVGGEEDEQQGFYGNWRFLDKKRFLWDAYFRYLTARWGYSTAIHSWELTNEGEPYNSNHWAMTDEMGKAMHCRVYGIATPTAESTPKYYLDNDPCTYQHPNAHLVTTSFYDSFPSSEFWGNPKYPNVDYADLHAYISTGWQSIAAHQFDAALYHLDYGQDVRQSLDYDASQNGIPTKPVIRGEGGIDYLTNQTEQAKLPQDTQGVWLHNLTWASLDPSGLIELYWWNETIDSQPGPDGDTQNGLIEIYRHFYQFASTLTLNNGHYQDLAAITTNTNLRVVGQKDLTNGHAHLWVQNINHTWINVVDKVVIQPQSDTITIPGFQPNTIYQLQPWDTYSGTPQSTTNLTADSQGQLHLQISNLTTDNAYKIINPDAPGASSMLKIQVILHTVTNLILAHIGK